MANTKAIPQKQPITYLFIGSKAIRGGPFDTWGAMVFPSDQTFFSTPSLNIQFFSDLIKSKQFFFSAVKLKTIFFTIYFI